MSLNDLTTFFVSIDGMPCTNRCQHCWTEGAVTHTRVPAAQMRFILDRLAEINALGVQTPFFFYDEPTFHPDFVAIMEYAASLGVIPEGYFLATNGSILAKAPNETWQRLKAAGIASLQFTFYGLAETHDAFAGRRGAYSHIVEAIQRAQTHEIDWHAGVVIHPDNVDELDEALTVVRDLDPDGRAHVGAFSFMWQGRGRDADRIREFDLERFEYAMSPMWQTERDIVAHILESPELAATRASDPLICEALPFHVDRNLRVFTGASCDSGGVAAAVPELREHFLVGTLDEAGFLPLIERYQTNPPLGIAYLTDVTWSELAHRYGNPDNDEIYFVNDLPANKWAAQYLIDKLT